MRTVLQIPLTTTLKQNATLAAEELGFSSLQEVVRVMLKQLADKQILVSVGPDIPLSSQAEDRYSQMNKDFAAHKNSATVSSVDELLSELNAD